MLIEPELATTLGAISGIVGLVAVLYYVYFNVSLMSAKRSISEIVEGEPLISANQVMQAMAQFQGDEARLKALSVIMRHDKVKAALLLTKIKDNVDIGKIEVATSKSTTRLSLTLGVVFLVISFILIYYYRPARKPDPIANSETPTGGYAPHIATCNWTHKLQFVNNVNDARLEKMFPDLYSSTSGDERVKQLGERGYFYASQGGGGRRWTFDIGDWGLPADAKIQSEPKITSLNLGNSDLFKFSAWKADARHITVQAYSDKGGQITQIGVEFLFSTSGDCPPAPTY